ncbi:MAG TPA: transporter substrate-binding domain-containing protein [Abditibacterium sp.]|jgi:polar amino acid transport system substrate-binding protein
MRAPLFVVWLVLFVISPVFAQNPTPAPLQVATREIAPFVTQKDGKYSGFSIDLWNAIADELGVESKFSSLPNVAAQIDAVRGGRADVGIAATSITAKRDRLVDFSQPFYDSGLQILVRGDGGSPSLLDGLWQVLKSPLMKQFIIAVLVLMLVPAHIVYFVERGHEEGIVRHKSYFPGIFEAIWWTVSCLATQSEEMPKHTATRILAVIWMFFAIIFTAYVTAALTANLTLDALRGDIQGPSDLPGKRVATLASSTSETYLRESKVQMQTFPTIDAALEALETRKVEAVVYDAPILSYYAANKGKGRVALAGAVFRRESYGIVLPNGSPWRKKINYALLTLRENGTYDSIHDKWFGSEE